MKYFKNYDIIYVKQKSKVVFIVIGLYPNETDRKRSGTRAPLRGYVYAAGRTADRCGGALCGVCQTELIGEISPAFPPVKPTKKGKKRREDALSGMFALVNRWYRILTPKSNYFLFRGKLICYDDFRL